VTSRHGNAHARTRPPRLVLRFAVYTAIGLAFAGAGIFLLVRSYATSQAELSIKYHARFVAESALGDRLYTGDFARPVARERLAELDVLFRQKVLVDGVLRGSLYGRDGRVAYSSDHRLIGRRTPDSDRVWKALRSRLVGSSVSHLDAGTADRGPKVLKEFVPFRFGMRAPAGVFVLDQDYAPIARAARTIFLPIVGVLEFVLLALYFSFLPILRRVGLRLRQQLEEIEHQALHDSLTGLPNRALFRDRVEQALLAARRNGERVAVMLIDLDRFKEVNDTLGHDSGDRLLQELGRRLQGVLRDSDSVARLGGDEFGVLLPVDVMARVGNTAGRVHKALESPFQLDELSLDVGASIGVALFPENGDDVETLVKHADVAMYTAKERKTGYEVYAAEVDSNDARRLSLAAELRGAVERGELVVHYQPKARLDTGAIESVEALVRWNHPDRGVLPPLEFVPLAEQTGAVKPMTLHVLNKALRQCRAWEDNGFEVRIAVNLDMRNLLDLRFPEEVDVLLREWRLPAARLELEITESTIMADPVRVRRVANKLSAMGVGLAIDDFGTGYSSLRYLKSLPLDEIKIDKSFVLRMSEDRSDATIVRTTIDMARNLGLRVVAEGVETAEVWEALRAIGCDLAQGYFLARPSPPEEMGELLRERVPAANTSSRVVDLETRRYSAGRATR
jgi:diguanylate cyclase (GGDEF)-like protein